LTTQLTPVDYEVSDGRINTSSEYHEFLRLELPPQMQQRLATEIESILDPDEEGIDQRLRDHLPEIIRTVHQGLFTIFDQARQNGMARAEPQSITNAQLSSDLITGSTGAIPFTADDWLDNFWPMDELTFSSPDGHDWQVVPTFD
jgi:hypothetical protein